MYQSPEYQVWKAMIARCKNPRNKAFKNYGARGITFDPVWGMFSQFIADMGRRPSSAHTLERKDNNAGYSKSNCVWATRKEQQRNQRRTVYITIGGLTRSRPEWCEHFGLNPKSVSYRMRHGWNPVQAILTPLEKNKPKRKGHQ